MCGHEISELIVTLISVGVATGMTFAWLNSSGSVLPHHHSHVVCLDCQAMCERGKAVGEFSSREAAHQEVLLNAQNQAKELSMQLDFANNKLEVYEKVFKALRIPVFIEENKGQ